MNDIDIANKMIAIAEDLITKRYPVGWGGAAVIRTEDDSYYSSVYVDAPNEAACLCMETGAICEVHKFNKKATHCVGVVRDDEKAPFKVLTPCGICQERLRFWGDKVKVGVTTNDNSLLFKELKELQPYHWTFAYDKTDI